MRIETCFLFDLDGTLVDSVYQHVLAWNQALDAEGISLSVWRIHRKIGMSGACSPTSSCGRRGGRSATSMSPGWAGCMRKPTDGSRGRSALSLGRRHCSTP